MSPIRALRTSLAFAALLVFALPARGSAQPPAAPAQASRFPAPTQRDGQHDFDFIVGTWKMHLKKLLHPLTGSTTWVEYDGTSRAHKVMDGKANLDEMNVENATTHERVQGMTLRLYNPTSHQWSLYWASAKSGELGLPADVGHFTDGRGEFYDEEDFQGRRILVRYLWTDITPSSARFEQAFSVDQGKTWETNWITTMTRVKR